MTIPRLLPRKNCATDACITVDQDVEGEGGIGIQTIPGGEYAVTTHEGPYEKLETTYAELMGQWLPQSGREMNEACFEVYLNDPTSTPPEKLLTDIYLGLK